jgi:hypothetical protein
MEKVFLWMGISIILAGCSDKKAVDKYPVIDVVSSIGDYQTTYCSDFFSSIELIPLETNKNFLISNNPIVFVYDSLILVSTSTSVYYFSDERNLFVFNRSGKFLNQIGRMGKGPGEFRYVAEVFLNVETSTIFVYDYTNILEYEFNGKFIRSSPVPTLNSKFISRISYVDDDLFVGSIYYGNKDKYCLFDRNGDIVKVFPSHYFTDGSPRNSYKSSLHPFRIDKHLYLKDYINDTIYTLVNLNLQPAFVFDFGKYSYPLGKINEEGRTEITLVSNADILSRYMIIEQMVGTPKYFFYSILAPPILPRPKARPKPIFFSYESDVIIHGIYNIAENTNILLDTDSHLQKGIINDINGGLPFFPKYYAGNGIVVDVWQAEDMKEILTEEYFAARNIKDRQAHQKLRELLAKLKEEDNGAVVLAKLK